MVEIYQSSKETQFIRVRSPSKFGKVVIVGIILLFYCSFGKYDSVSQSFEK